MVNRKGSGGRTRRNNRTKRGQGRGKGGGGRGRGGGRSLSERFRRFVRGTPDMYTPPSGTRGRRSKRGTDKRGKRGKGKRSNGGKDKRTKRVQMNGGFLGQDIVKRSRGIQKGDTITAKTKSGGAPRIFIFNVDGTHGTKPNGSIPLNNGGRHIVIDVKKEGKFGSKQKWLYLEGELKILEENAEKYENPIVTPAPISGASILSEQQIAQMF